MPCLFSPNRSDCCCCVVTKYGGITNKEWKARSIPMVLGYTAHAVPMQLVFYTAHAFPREHQEDAFATMRGSWNRETPSGYEIVRIHFADGQARSFEHFVAGFLTDQGKTHIARAFRWRRTAPC